MARERTQTRKAAENSAQNSSRRALRSRIQARNGGRTPASRTPAPRNWRAPPPNAAAPQVDDEEVDDEEVDDEEDVVTEEENDNDHDPLKGASNALQRAQIMAIMAEEKRKQEKHELEIRRLASMAGPSTSTSAPVVEDDFGENLLSISERQQILSFPTVPKKHVIAIARNTFDPGNLPYLENLIVDDLTSDVNITFEDGKLKQSKNVGKASAIKTPSMWSKNFITYVRIVSIFYGTKHPQIVDKLLEFHNDIIDLALTYDWQKAVLGLALLHHRTALCKGFADLDAWKLPSNLIDRYCRGHLRPSQGSKTLGQSGGKYTTYDTNPTNKQGVLCMNYNFKSCNTDRCKRDHKCAQCGGGHPAKTCNKPKKDDNKE
jgi:hypothetical protein